MIFLRHFSWKDDISNIWKDSGRSLLHLSNHRKDHLSIKLKICKKFTFPEQNNVVKTIFPTFGKTQEGHFYIFPIIEKTIFPLNQKSVKRSPFLNKVMSSRRSFRTLERSRKMIFLKQYAQKDDLSNIWKDSGRSLLHLSNHRKDHLSWTK